LQSQAAPFAVFCDDEPAIPAPVLSSGFAVFEDKPSPTVTPAIVAAQKSSSFSVFCDEPERQHSAVTVVPATGLTTAAPAALSFAVFCDEDDNVPTNVANAASAVVTPHKDLNSSLASLHWSPLSCIAEESTMMDGRASLLDGSMCKGIRSVGRSSRKRRLSGTDFAYEDTEVLPSLAKCAEPYTEIEKLRLNRLAMNMLLKHPGMFGHADATFNQPFAFKAAKGKVKEKLKAFDCQWEVLEPLGKGGFGTVISSLGACFIAVGQFHNHLLGVQGPQ